MAVILVAVLAGVLVCQVSVAFAGVLLAVMLARSAVVAGHVLVKVIALSVGVTGVLGHAALIIKLLALKKSDVGICKLKPLIDVITIFVKGMLEVIVASPKWVVVLEGDEAVLPDTLISEQPKDTTSFDWPITSNLCCSDPLWPKSEKGIKTAVTGLLYVTVTVLVALVNLGKPAAYPLEFEPQSVAKELALVVPLVPPLTVVVICALTIKENSTTVKTIKICFLDEVFGIVFIFFGKNLSISLKWYNKF